MSLYAVSDKTWQTTMHETQSVSTALTPHCLTTVRNSAILKEHRESMDRRYRRLDIAFVAGLILWTVGQLAFRLLTQ